MGRRTVIGVIAIAALLAAALFLLRDRPAPGTPPSEPGAAPTAAPPVPGLGASPARLEVPRDPAATEPAPSAPDGPSPAPATAAPAGAPVLVVTVLALPAGTPLADATVEMRTNDEEGRVLAVRTTEGDGVARFEGLGVDNAQLRVTAPGRALERVSVSELSKPGERAVAVRLEPGFAISGIVLAAKSRRPVADAAVEAEQGGKVEGMSSVSSHPWRLDTRTDAVGRFRVDALPRGQIFTIGVSAPGFVRGEHALLLGEGAEEHPVVEILLEESCAAEGTVLGPEGAPVSGATVWAFAAKAGEGEAGLAALETALGVWGFGASSVGRATADDGGRWAIDGLPAGRAYRFVARGGGFARSRASDPPSIAAEAGVRLQVSLRLRPPSILRVRVVDPEGGVPEGAQAYIRVDEFGRLAAAAEDAGVSRFDSLLAGEYDVEGECDGFDVAREKVVMGEAESREVRLVLVRSKPAPAAEPSAAPKSGKVRLRLVPPTGAALPARVKVAVEEVDEGGSSSDIDVGPEGRIEVTQVLPRPVRLVVFADGFAPAVREVTLTPGEERDLGAIALDAGAELSGVVRDGSGSPLAGVRVRVSLPGFESTVATTGADGRYRIPRLPPGDLSLRVGSPGLLDGRDSVTIVGGAVVRDYALVPPVTVRGTVKGPDGKAPAEAIVVLLLQGEPPPGVPRDRRASVEADGTFTLGVAAGTHAVEVRDFEDRVLLRREGVEVGASTDPIDLLLP